MSPYELRALEEIRLWRNPPRAWHADYTEPLGRTWNEVTDLVHRVPGFDWTLENVVAGLLDLVNEITQDSVFDAPVRAAFADAGVQIGTLADIHGLDLEEVDRAMKSLPDSYIALATAEGAATGLAGAAGLVPDILSLVAITLRAAGETATYCGFDITRPEERLEVLEVLNAVASSGDARKQVIVTPTVRTASRLARQQTSQLLEQIGLKLTEKKLAQFIPLAGAVVGGGLNYLYTRNVCTTAHNHYRERFLRRKYAG